MVGFSQENTVRLKRETIGASGTSSKSPNFNVQSTIGQASLVSNETDNSYLQLSQGFQKAASRKLTIDDWFITVFPNPNNGEFNFTTTLPANEAFNFEILDAQGRLIKANSGVGGSTITVNLVNVFDGYYFLKVQTKNSSSTFKLAIFQ